MNFVFAFLFIWEFTLYVNLQWGFMGYYQYPFVLVYPFRIFSFVYLIICSLFIVLMMEMDDGHYGCGLRWWRCMLLSVSTDSSVFVLSSVQRCIQWSFVFWKVNKPRCILLTVLYFYPFLLLEIFPMLLKGVNGRQYNIC